MDPKFYKNKKGPITQKSTKAYLSLSPIGPFGKELCSLNREMFFDAGRNFSNHHTIFPNSHRNFIFGISWWKYFWKIWLNYITIRENHHKLP